MIRPSLEVVGKLLVLTVLLLFLIALLLGSVDRPASAFLAELAGTAFFPCVGVWMVGYGRKHGRNLYFGFGLFLVLAGGVWVVSRLVSLFGSSVP